MRTGGLSGQLHVKACYNSRLLCGAAAAAAVSAPVHTNCLLLKMCHMAILKQLPLGIYSVYHFNLALHSRFCDLFPPSKTPSPPSPPAAALTWTHGLEADGGAAATVDDGEDVIER